jgi:methylenetetrahydrofolate--tRNA-(uracil-5-)-methyltransferase
MSKIQPVHIVGAGLAGTELSLQLAHRGIPVELYEMRPEVMTEAHKTDLPAELVCSNSFGSLNPISAPGQLKWEAEQCGSFVLKAAKLAQVPAGQALGIDRAQFSSQLNEWLNAQTLIRRHNQLIRSIDEIPRPAVICTGPLTQDQLANSLQSHFDGDHLYFFDAIAPIVDADSLNREIIFSADRYDKGTPDYLNCPLEKCHYLRLIDEIQRAEKVTPKSFEQTPFFEGCMPIEEMVRRGHQTLRFGPLKPVGLIDPRTNRRPYAVVQLRAENRMGTSYNLVGFQTRMTYSEQKRVLRMIPGLENAEFLKLGSMHRNLFVCTPKVLTDRLCSRNDSQLFFAGQITGVEGYFESTCIALLVGQILTAQIFGKAWSPPPQKTALGALFSAITGAERVSHFQPTNINFGLFPPLDEQVQVGSGTQRLDKAQRKEQQILRAKSAFLEWYENSSVLPNEHILQKRSELPHLEA